MGNHDHHHHIEAQRDVSAMLESTGSDVISWEQQRGPGETDLEAYWKSGNRWLLRVRTPYDEPDGPGELSRLRLRASAVGALPVLAWVDGMRVEFRSILDETLLEIPEE
jgi:hypothetical protein